MQAILADLPPKLLLALPDDDLFCTTLLQFTSVAHLLHHADECTRRFDGDGEDERACFEMLAARVAEEEAKTGLDGAAESDAEASPRALLHRVVLARLRRLLRRAPSVVALIDDCGRFLLTSALFYAQFLRPALGSVYDAGALETAGLVLRMGLPQYLLRGMIDGRQLLSRGTAEDGSLDTCIELTILTCWFVLADRLVLQRAELASALFRGSLDPRGLLRKVWAPAAVEWLITGEPNGACRFGRDSPRALQLTWGAQTVEFAWRVVDALLGERLHGGGVVLLLPRSEAPMGACGPRCRYALVVDRQTRTCYLDDWHASPEVRRTTASSVLSSRPTLRWALDALSANMRVISGVHWPLEADLATERDAQPFSRHSPEQVPGLGQDFLLAAEGLLYPTVNAPGAPQPQSTQFLYGPAPDRALPGAAMERLVARNNDARLRALLVEPAVEDDGTWAPLRPRQVPVSIVPRTHESLGLARTATLAELFLDVRRQQLAWRQQRAAALQDARRRTAYLLTSSSSSASSSDALSALKALIDAHLAILLPLTAPERTHIDDDRRNAVRSALHDMLGEARQRVSEDLRRRMCALAAESSESRLTALAHARPCALAEAFEQRRLCTLDELSLFMGRLCYDRFAAALTEALQRGDDGVALGGPGTLETPHAQDASRTAPYRFVCVVRQRLVRLATSAPDEPSAYNAGLSLHPTYADPVNPRRTIVHSYSATVHNTDAFRLTPSECLVFTNIHCSRPMPLHALAMPEKEQTAAK